MNSICQSFWFQVCSPWQLSFLIKELTCSAILSSSSISCQSQLCSWAAPIWYAPIVGLLISAVLFNISCILICYYLYHHSPLRTQGRDKYLIVPRTIIYKQSNSINHTIFILEDKGFACFLFCVGVQFCCVCGFSFCHRRLSFNSISWNTGQHFYTTGASIYKESEKNCPFL